MKGNNSPRWITARFDSRCNNCQKAIKKGVKAFYYPNDKYILCESCGFPKYREMRDLMEYEDSCAERCGL